MESKSTAAESTPKSTRLLPAPVPLSLQPSALDAAVRSVTQPETTSSPLSEKVALASLLSLVLALQTEVMSSDVWFLATLKAESLAMRYGVTPEDFEKVVLALEQIRVRMRNSNPMASMFA